MINVRRLHSVCAALVMLASSPIYAQDFRATVNGRITDVSGGGVPAAKVVARNLETGAELATTSGSDGAYTILSMPPGRYEIVAEATGFKRTVRGNLQLQVSETRTVDITMEVGEVTEQVTVTADAPLLEETTATRGGVIENLRVTELPLNGRNPFMLAGLNPGVQFAGNPIFTRPFDNGENIAWSINGGVRQANEFLLDGAPNNAVTDADGARTRSQNNIAYIPPVDAVQEFRVITNFYDSQYGRTGGGVFNAITKAGTNELHGTVYEFLRRYQLDANTLDANSAGLPRYARDPVTGENIGGRLLDQYGVNLTGPVVLPGLYNGRDKTFFMFQYEGYRERVPEPAQGFVPTLLERQGNFSQSGLTVYDPFTTRENPNFNTGAAESASNPRYIRDVFPNNIIPQNRLNPVGLALVNAFPEPNRQVAPGQRIPNFIASPNLNRDDFKSLIGRVDQNFGDRLRMFVRYVYNNRDQIANASGFEGLGADRQDPLVRRNHGLVVDTVSVLNASTVLTLRGSVTRFNQSAYRQSVIGFDAASLGFPESFSAARPTAIPPRLEFANGEYTTFGSRNPNANITNTLTGQANISHIRGKHSLRAGLEYRDIRVNISGGSFVWGGGLFQFSPAFTQRLPQYSETGSGSSLASLLVGAPNSGLVEIAPAPAFRWPYVALFFQDDIRVTRRLSLNLGLRWDMEGAPTERYNQQNRGFAFEQASPLAPQVQNATPANCPACANLTGGLLFANQDNRGAFTSDLNNWQPRIGAAYQIGPNTVLRGGYGVFYLPQANFGGTLGFGIQTPFISTLGGGAQGFTPANLLSNPFPNGILSPTGAALGLNTGLGSDIRFALVDRDVPYAHQYSFGLQHQLPWSIRIDTSYVGSRTVGLNTGDHNAGNARNINVNTVEQLAQARQNPNYFNEAVANPFAGLIPQNATLNAPTIRRELLLRPYPQFGAVFQSLESVGKLYYDSWQTQIEKRFSDGLVFVASHTWAKNIEAISFLNAQDAEPTRSLTAWDRRQRLVLSGVWQLPFGRGHRFGSDIGRGWDLLLGGWEYTVIGTFQDGSPIDYPDLDIIGDPTIDNATNNRFFNPCVQQLNGTARAPNAARTGFEPCTDPAWAVRGPFTLRTTPFRSPELRNPWRPQFDMSLNKRFNFTERVSAQLRLETFNTFNTPILRGPNLNPNAASFGWVNPGSQANQPRNVQLGFKLNF